MLYILLFINEELSRLNWLRVIYVSSSVLINLFQNKKKDGEGIFFRLRVLLNSLIYNLSTKNMKHEVGTFSGKFHFLRK